MKKYNTAILVFMSLLFAATLSSGETLDVSSDVDASNINIGDRVRLTVKADNPQGFDIIFPDKPDLPPDFSFFGYNDIRSGWPSSRIHGREYIIGIYSTGRQIIPPVEIRYKKPDNDEWSTAYSLQVPVKVTSLLTGKETDIRDIKGLAFIESITRFVISGILIFAAIMAIGALGVYIKKRYDISNHREILTAHELAYRQLQDLRLKDLIAKGMIKEYYTELSDIARHYLENRFSLRAPEMTTEEFLASVKGVAIIAEEDKKILGRFMSHCDMVKFAKYGPKPEETTESMKTIEEFVDSTKEEEEEK